MYTKKEKETIKKLAKGVKPRGLKMINLNAAGIDISPKVHAVAVGEGRDPKGRDVRLFGPTTLNLYEIAKWLEDCEVDTVAMESTGVYWIPLFEILERRGIEVILVHANAYRNVPGKKTDVKDSQWLQTLHTFGLLRGCYRPAEEILPMRTYSRERQDLVEDRSRQLQKMQKALDQMNVLVHRAVSDISGTTGMGIIRAIVRGERDPQKLAELRDARCKKSVAEIAEALTGNFLQRHVFSLRLALQRYDHIQEMISECDEQLERAIREHIPKQFQQGPADEVEQRLEKFKPRKGDPQFNMPLMAKKILGVDCTAVDGISIRTMMTFICEIGYDLSAWETDKHFASWLTLCPGNHKSGGKQSSGRTRKSSNRLAKALRNAANTLDKNQGPLGAYLRKMKARLGKAKGITATAHKLARIVFTMIRTGQEYNPELVKNQNSHQRKKFLKNLEKRALEAGYILVPREAA